MRKSNEKNTFYVVFWGGQCSPKSPEAERVWMRRMILSI